MTKPNVEHQGKDGIYYHEQAIKRLISKRNEKLNTEKIVYDAQQHPNSKRNECIGAN